MKPAPSKIKMFKRLKTNKKEGAGLRFELAFILILSSLTLKVYGEDVPSAPSDVYIDQSRNLLMVKRPNDIPRPYIIKGVSWSPAARAPFDGPNPLGPEQPPVQYGFFFDWPGRNPQGSEVLNYWLKNQILENYLTDLPLIKNLNANTVRVLSSLGSSVEDYRRIAPEMLKVLDECYKNNLMVIMTVAISKNDLDSGRYIEVVRSYKDHPAILMWVIGNEWNINRLFGAWTIEEASAVVNQAAQEIKGIDPHHPVSSILAPNFTNPDIGGCPSVGLLKEIIPGCPHIDLWGLNVYRGVSFGSLFQEWADLWKKDLQQPAKPFYLSEFGIDSFYTTSYNSEGECQFRARAVSGNNDYPGQADIEQGLWKEIKSHLSLVSPDELCLGGLIHEFNDSLWKVGNFHVGLGGLLNYDGQDNQPGTPDDDHSYDDYNNEGFVLAGGSPDNVLNEEHFGLVDADRRPKIAYERMRNEWSKSSSIPIFITNPRDNTPHPPQEEIKLEVSILREHKCALAINLKATSSFQPQAKLSYKIINPHAEVVKKGRLLFREHKKYYFRTITGLPVAPYTVEVESDKGAKTSTNIGSYHTPLDELVVGVSLRRSWFYPKRKGVIIKALSTQQPHACLRYKIIDAKNETVKKGKMWFHRKGKGGEYKTYPPDESFKPLYLPKGNYKLVVESTHGGRKEIDFGV